VTAPQVRTWEQAAADLGFRFLAPYTLESEGKRIEYFGHLPDFGSKRGMLVIVGSYTADQLEAAEKQGFGYSCLSADNSPYDRDQFIEMLKDWGWSSTERSAPEWVGDA
jgi:hypothetical protein